MVQNLSFCFEHMQLIFIMNDFHFKVLPKSTNFFYVNIKPIT